MQLLLQLQRSILESLLDLKQVLLVALDIFLWYLLFFEATLFQWSHQIDDYNQNSVHTLSIIKVGSMSSLREAKLQSPLPSNSANLLSLQETLGCSSRMPGNLNVFNGFSKWIKSDDLKDLTCSRHAKKLNQKIRLLTTNVQRFDNRVNIWRTYYAGRFIYKAITYKWIIITRKSTCNSTHQHIDGMKTIRYQTHMNKPE